MGSPAVRITPQDFVTPPEFRGLSLARRSAGQIGGVRLELRAEGKRTRLGRCYQQVPLRVLPPFQLEGEPAALLYLINPTAGLMDGDGHLVEIDAASGTRAIVTGQSATRMHPCPRNYSTQQWRIRAAEGSQLVVLPGPAIPYRQARSFQRVNVNLEKNAAFLWCDIWYPGRSIRGMLTERFIFDSLIQETEIRREGQLVFRDRFHWQGPWNAETVAWHFGSNLAFGTLFITGDIATDSIHRADGVHVAAMPLAAGDTCIRWLGSPAGVLHSTVRTALCLAAGWSEAGGIPWLLARKGLAHNHWFSPEPGQIWCY